MRTNKNDTVTSAPPTKLKESYLDTTALHGGENGELALLTRLAYDLAKPMLEIDAITLSVLIKQVQEKLDLWRRKLVKKANAEFADLEQAWPGVSKWNIADVADITAYYPAGSWTYPPEIAKLAAQLKDAQLKAQVEKTAVYKPGMLGSDTFAFKVTMREGKEIE